MYYYTLSVALFRSIITWVLLKILWHMPSVLTSYSMWMHLVNMSRQLLVCVTQYLWIFFLFLWVI